MDGTESTVSVEQVTESYPKEQPKERFELLIFSEAGKPVYSYTKREDAVTLMPLCSALMYYSKRAQQETIRSIKTSDGLVINFAARSPLVIIVIHEANSYVDSPLLIEQVEAQIISILTAKTLRSVFEERPTFDLKRLLYGSEKLIDATTCLCASSKDIGSSGVEAFIAVSSSNSSLLRSGSSNSVLSPSLSLPARPHRVLVPVVIMPTSKRDSIHTTIQNVISSNSKNLVFTLLFKVIVTNKSDKGSNSEPDSSSHESDDQQTNKRASPEVEEVEGFELLSICNHHDQHKIKIADIHIIFALLTASRAQLSSVESLWMPVCLPRFNQDAFLHSYIAYMNNKRLSIVMMSINRDEFSNCQKSRDLIEEKLDPFLNDPGQAMKSPLDLAYLDLNSKIQFLWYQTSKQVFWWHKSKHKSLNPVMYYVTRKMLQASLKNLWLRISNDTTFLGWHVPSFQLYAQFDGTITTTEASEVVQRFTHWVKREDDNFTIKEYR